MSNNNEIEELKIILNVIGSSTRARILQLIAERPFYLSEIARTLNIGQQAIIRHMRKLEESGIVDSYKEEARQSRIPRSYYTISKNTNIIVRLTKNGLTIEEIKIKKPKNIILEVDKIFPEISKFNKEYEKISEIKDPLKQLKELRKLEEEIKKYRNFMKIGRSIIDSQLNELNKIIRATKYKIQEY
ncbi:MAG: helix-turn-helix domain-containing protein [Candidatus Ranarchaeia archaeon]